MNKVIIIASQEKEASLAQSAKGRRLRLRFLLAGGGVLLLVGLLFTAYSRQNPDQLEMGKPAPDFTLADLSGTSVRLSQLRGQVVLVTFWRTD